MVPPDRPQRTLIEVLGSIVIAVVTVVIGIHGAINYQERRDAIFESMQADAAESLERLTATVAPFMAAYAVNEYEKLVASEIALMKHFAIVVRDRRMGEITGFDTYTSGLIRKPDGGYEPFNESDDDHLRLLQSAYYHDGAEILSDQGETIGRVTVYASDEAIRAAQRRVLMGTLALEAATTLFLATLLILTAKRLFVMPLQQIARTIETRDADGIPTQPVSRQNYRELDVLAQAMNRMMERVSESRDALNEERTRLEHVIAGTNAGVWEWNVQTGETRFNARWAEIAGYTLEELEPVSIAVWTRLAHPEDLERSNRALERHFSGELAYYECETRMRHKAGHWIWVLDRGRVASWTGDGKPLKMFGIHLDITENKRQALRLAASESRFRGFFERNASVMLLIDPQTGTIEDANRAAERFYGYANDALVGMRIDEINTLPSAEPATERKNSFRFRHRLADGELRDVEVRSTPIEVDNRELLFSIVHDISDRVRAEAQLQLAASVFTHAREGIMITDGDTRIVDVNGAFTRITGYRREEVLGHTPHLLSSGRQDRAFYEAMWRDLLDNGYWYGELWNRRKNGEPFAALQTISAVRDADNDSLHYVSLFSDITTLKENERELEHIAHYDALTGLPNRLLMGDRLRQAMLQEERRNQRVAVVFLDLDGFKAVNDAHGHEVGDQLLVKISERMRAVLRESDTLSRIGGDEFVAVLPDLPSQNDCLPLLTRLLETASRPVHLAGEQLRVTASLGVTFYPQADDVDADQLLRQADQSMYQAKVSGKNRYHVFDAEQDRDLRGRHERLERIQQALIDDEFELFYQPKVNMRSGEMIGVEALLRWHHPQRGLLPPGRFLPVIEGHEVMVEIGEMTLQSALRQLDDWQQKGLHTRASVNIAASHLQRSDFVDRLQAVLSAHPRISPEQLELEILETSALENMSHVSRVIEDCQRIGVTFALDDFGTGYSSLTYLKRLPAQVLKIDRSFVRDMHDDPEDLTILEGVISLAEAFQRQVIAEGVESEEHGELLLWLGCELAQGYGIAKPMTGRELLRWQAEWRPPARWPATAAIDRDRLPVVFAMVQHRAWFESIKAHLADESAPLPTLDPGECRLGRWLQSGHVAAEGAAFTDLTHLHRKVHDIAKALLRHEPHRGPDEQARLKASLSEVRDELLDRLARLLTA